MLNFAQALRRSALVALGLAALAGTAAAQVDPQNEPAPSQAPYGGATYGAPAPVEQDVDVNVQPQYQQPQYTMQEPSREETPSETLERYGIAVALGGGVSDFTNSSARSLTDTGGSWNVRVGIGTRSPVGFEAAYIGSAQGLDALGLDNDAVLVGNGIEGVARVNILDMNIQPFVFGGVAWRRYDVTNTSFNTSAVNDKDDVLEIPMGLGLAWKYRGFLLDARGEFRYTDQNDLMPSINDDGTFGTDDAELHRWGVNANIGYAF
jgi:hypothetical protein